MKKLTLKNIAAACGGTLIRGEDSVSVSGVSTDTRAISEGDVFFALIGDNFDAHDFLSGAIEQGADALVISDSAAVPAGYDGGVVLVSDTLAAYQDLAAYYRDLIAPYTIAVTGSVGKTSLKDMIAQIVSPSYRTVYTDKNYNNHIGVPKTIFGMDEDTQVLILEMGMNHPGEISRLACIGRPDVCAITNIGLSHRENFTDDEGIFNAKMEIVTYFSGDQKLIINADDERLQLLVTAPDLCYRLVTCGQSDGCEYRITQPVQNSDATISFDMDHLGEHTHFDIPAAGIFNGVTAAIAVACVSALGITPSQAAGRLTELKRTPHRLELSEGRGVLVIDDTYNASPDSMKAAIDFLMSVSAHRKIAAFAGMNELGEKSPELHRAVGRYAAASGVDFLAAVGEKAHEIAEGYREVKDNPAAAIEFDNNEAASVLLRAFTEPGDAVLVKGSRSYKTEEIAAALLKPEQRDEE
ncbi:MAG: UDP-N-acetylmuramoyl-tripeptide--D-alanyl-D-alanine ligase [Clostridiales Family XIII bacterium]|nr:UDP-N-acetylmuramoyl-tripeptide--D-alanyl-D-alanine ligase [Clostridiales Family XIII bacterium]